MGELTGDDAEDIREHSFSTGMPLVKAPSSNVFTPLTNYFISSWRTLYPEYRSIGKQELTQLRNSPRGGYFGLFCENWWTAYTYETVSNRRGGRREDYENRSWQELLTNERQSRSFI
jgi:hypothetical protein